MRVLITLPIVVLCGLGGFGGSLDAQVRRLERLSPEQLSMPIPGVAVIRDSASWVTLWQRFESAAWDGHGELSHADIPVVDFRKNMLIAVSMGGTSGCANAARYVREIRERRDSIVVTVSRGWGRGELTCAMYIEPIDVVATTRSNKPVAFHGSSTADRLLLPPATWWRQFSAADVETMPERQLKAFANAIARDPATPVPTLDALARSSVVKGGISGWLLLYRPDVVASPSVLIALARSLHDEKPVEILFTKHGEALARDPKTPADILAKLIMKLMPTWTEQHATVAELLLGNQTVRSDRALLDALIRWTYRRPALRDSACKVFLAQWSPWERMLNVDGSPGVNTPWYSRISCPGIPPKPVSN